MLSEMFQLLSNLTYLAPTVILFYKEYFLGSFLFLLLVPSSEWYHACNDPYNYPPTYSYVFQTLFNCEHSTLTYRMLTTFLDYFLANLAPISLSFKFMTLFRGDYAWYLTGLSAVLLFFLSFAMGLLNVSDFPPQDWRLGVVNAGVVLWLVTIYFVHAGLYVHNLRAPFWTSLKNFYKENYNVPLLITGIVVGVIGLVIWRVFQPLYPEGGLYIHAGWHFLCAIATAFLSASLPPRWKLKKALMWPDYGTIWDTSNDFWSIFIGNNKEYSTDLLSPEKASILRDARNEFLQEAMQEEE